MEGKFDFGAFLLAIFIEVSKGKLNVLAKKVWGQIMKDIKAAETILIPYYAL